MREPVAKTKVELGDHSLSNVIVIQAKAPGLDPQHQHKSQAQRCVSVTPVLGLRDGWVMGESETGGS